MDLEMVNDPPSIGYVTRLEYDVSTGVMRAEASTGHVLEITGLTADHVQFDASIGIPDADGPWFWDVLPGIPIFEKHTGVWGMIGFRKFGRDLMLTLTAPTNDPDPDAEEVSV